MARKVRISRDFVGTASTRKASSRVIINRAAMSKLAQGVADGMAEVGRTILDTADTPDGAPYGKGLVSNGGFLIYQGARKVDGAGLDGRQPKKPRAVNVKGTEGSITLMVGWGFPGRFLEYGTVDTAAQPFATPAVNRVVPHAADIVRPHVHDRVGR